MPTLADACASLQVNRVTLRKWLARLKIQPEQDEYDTRFRLISDEDVEAIRTARGKMPTVAHKPNMPPATLRAKSDGLDSSPDRFPIPTVKKRRQQPLSASVSAGSALPPIPEGHIGRNELAKMHGLPPATVIYWTSQGMIETLPGMFRPHGGTAGGFRTRDPVTPKGLADFYRLASPRNDFQSCPLCPHAEEE